MSLRQRGQRPSEATNEGGYYGQQAPAYGSSGGGGGQLQPPRTIASPPSSTGSGYNYGRTGSNLSNNSGGGYYNAGYNAAPVSGGAAPSTPAAARPAGAGAGGYAGYNNQATTPVGSQPSSGGYPNTAPPAYNAGGYTNQGGMNAPAPRAMNFEQSAGGYGNTANSSSANYGGYNPNAGTCTTSFGSSGSGPNPYSQKSKSSGFGLKQILTSLMALTLIVLTGTTVYFRSIMKATEVELNHMKDALEQKEKSGGRFSRGKERIPDPRNNNNNRGKEMKIPKGNAGAKNANNSADAQEKIKLEAEIAQLNIEITNHQSSHADLTKTHRGHHDTLRELELKRQDMLKIIDHSKYQLEDQVEETHMYQSMVDGLKEVEEYMKKREGGLFKRIDVLEGRIGRESWREASEWFGPGPHRVELEIEYPKVDNPQSDPSTWPRIRNKVHIEMAPLNLMPHVVNLFLQQVHHELWDGCSIISNAQHLFQVGPSYSEEEKATNPHFDHFHERGLEKVSYQEYSEDYPHVQWTVGMAGRPSGPDFYINKLDNALIHGPGGQTNTDDLHNEADPCFGRVVEGLDVLEEIGKVPTDPQRGYEISFPVVIIRARVLVLKENPVDGWREIGAGEMLDGQDDIMPLPKVAHGV